jgi:hypothetical protein
MFKAMFTRKGETTQTKAILVEELRKLAGITEKEISKMKRYANTSTLNPQPSTLNPKPPSLNPQPSTLNPKPKLRIREKFPFLAKDDCPDILKVLVSDMMTTHGRYVEAHAALTATPDDVTDEKTRRLAQDTVENFTGNRMIWKELEHYGQHGELLGEHPKVKAFIKANAYRQMTDLELARALANARSNISKTRKKIKAAKGNEEKTEELLAILDKWTAEKMAFDEEMQRRKKK